MSPIQKWCAAFASWTSMVATATLGQTPCGPEWTRGFGAPGADGLVLASAVHDDGSGPALYVSGYFGAVSSVPAAGFARWDGAEWSAIGGGPGFETAHLLSFDDGGGPDLYAAGGSVFGGGGPVIDYISRRDGSAWTPIGNGTLGGVQSLCVYDDGTGSALYAGHVSIPPPGSTYVYGVSRWNGTAWSVVGAPVFTGSILSLVPHDDGTGPSLWAACASSTLGSGLVRWNGSAWLPVAPGTGVGGIRRMTVFDDGSGTALLVAGVFSTIGGVAASTLARWNGTTFQPLGSVSPPLGVNAAVDCLGVFDFGSGPRLHIGGTFSAAGPFPSAGFAVWDGATWAAPAGTNPASPLPTRVFTMMPWPTDPQGPSLFIGGNFHAFGNSAARYVARYDGTAFTTLGSEGGLGDNVSSLAVHNDGTGPALYAGGTMQTAGSAVAGPIVRWNGTAWAGLPPGPGGFPSWYPRRVEPVGTLDFLGFPYLVAGGNFSDVTGFPSLGLAFFGPSGWLPAPGGGVAALGGAGTVNAIATRPGAFGEDLFVGGSFTIAGGVAAENVAHWDGLMWRSLGSGLTGGSVSSLRWFDAGQGGRLYAGGSFTSAGGIPASGFAVWDGAAWSVPSGPLYGPGFVTSIPWMVADLEVFDDGTGPSLYVAGTFRYAAPVTTTGIVRWNGTSWEAVGGGVSPLNPGQHAGVRSLEIFDDGRGPALYALGEFVQAGTVSARNVARWDGAAWEPLSAGIPTLIAALPCDLAAGDVGGGPQLFAGGWLAGAGSVPSLNLAAWSAARPRIVLDSVAGAGVFVRDSGLAPGVEVFNVFSFDTCGGGPGSGPYLGLCAADPAFLLAQVASPLGTVPFHFTASGPFAVFGPYSLPSGLALDALCITATGSGLCPSVIRRFVVP